MYRFSILTSIIHLCGNFCSALSCCFCVICCSCVKFCCFCVIDEGGCPRTIQLTHPGSVCTRKMPNRCRPDLAHRRQPRPDSGLGFQVRALISFQGIPSCLGSGGRGLLPGKLRISQVRWRSNLRITSNFRVTLPNLCQRALNRIA